MNISALFIQRPVMTTLIMTGLLIFGVVAYRGLPVADLPTVDYPTISVSASLPGASPETMAASVATPLEKQFSTIAGLDVISSTSYQGTTSITLQFELDRDVDAAAADVQAAITQTVRQLPQGIVPPSYQKVDPSAAPVILYALTSSSLPLSTLDEFGETTIAQRLSTVSGVAQVLVFGSQKYAVRIQLDPQALAARQLGIDEVARAVRDGNVNMPTGILWGTDRTYAVEADGQLRDAAGFRPLIVAYRNGAAVRLQDLGRVVDAVQDSKAAAWFNGERGIVLAIQRQPGTNTVEVTAAVREAMARLQAELPVSVNVSVLYDRSETIRKSVDDVKHTLYLTLALVVMVIFLFLRNLPATVIPSLALPMSLVGTFAVMSLLGYSLDNLSLMALTLSVGFVVDDAIVMLENIVRHMEMGKGRLEASLAGSREIGFTIVSMTLSLVAVFIPVLFLGGLIGRLFREFAVTISAAILVSGFVSLSLTPMLCSRFLQSSKEAAHGRFYHATERVYQSVLTAYERSLSWVMDRRGLALWVSGGLLLATMWLAVTIPKGFIPSEDQDQLRGTVEAAEGSSFDAMMRYQEQINAVMLSDSNVAGFMAATGGGRASTTNQSRMIIRLTPAAVRRLDADGVARELQSKLSTIPGVRVFLQNPPVINIGGRRSKALYQFTLQGSDADLLYASASALEQKLGELPQLQDVTTDLQVRNPQIRVAIDRERAAAFGVSPAQIESALYGAYGASQASTIYTDNNQYWVVIELLPEYQRDLSALRLLSVRGANGTLVPLAALATLTEGLGPLAVSHAGQLPAVTLSFNPAPGVSVGHAVAAVQEAATLELPSRGSPGLFPGPPRPSRRRSRDCWCC